MAFNTDLVQDSKQLRARLRKALDSESRKIKKASSVRRGEEIEHVAYLPAADETVDQFVDRSLRFTLEERERLKKERQTEKSAPSTPSVSNVVETVIEKVERRKSGYGMRTLNKTCDPGQRYRTTVSTSSLIKTPTTPSLNASNKRENGSKKSTPSTSGSPSSSSSLIHNNRPASEAAYLRRKPRIPLPPLSAASRSPSKVRVGVSRSSSKDKTGNNGRLQSGRSSFVVDDIPRSISSLSSPSSKGEINNDDRKPTIKDTNSQLTTTSRKSLTNERNRSSEATTPKGKPISNNNKKNYRLSLLAAALQQKRTKQKNRQGSSIKKLSNEPAGKTSDVQTRQKLIKPSSTTSTIVQKLIGTSAGAISGSKTDDTDDGDDFVRLSSITPASGDLTRQEFRLPGHVLEFLTSPSENVHSQKNHPSASKKTATKDTVLSESPIHEAGDDPQNCSKMLESHSDDPQEKPPKLRPQIGPLNTKRLKAKSIIRTKTVSSRIQMKSSAAGTTGGNKQLQQAATKLSASDRAKAIVEALKKRKLKKSSVAAAKIVGTNSRIKIDSKDAKSNPARVKLGRKSTTLGPKSSTASNLETDSLETTVKSFPIKNFTSDIVKSSLGYQDSVKKSAAIRVASKSKVDPFKASLGANYNKWKQIEIIKALPLFIASAYQEFNNDDDAGSASTIMTPGNDAKDGIVENGVIKKSSEELLQILGDPVLPLPRRPSMGSVPTEIAMNNAKKSSATPKLPENPCKGCNCDLGKASGPTSNNATRPSSELCKECQAPWKAFLKDPTDAVRRHPIHLDPCSPEVFDCLFCWFWRCVKTSRQAALDELALLSSLSKPDLISLPSTAASTTSGLTSEKNINNSAGSRKSAAGNLLQVIEPSEKPKLFATLRACGFADQTTEKNQPIPPETAASSKASEANNSFSSTSSDHHHHHRRQTPPSNNHHENARVRIVSRRNPLGAPAPFMSGHGISALPVEERELIINTEERAHQADEVLPPMSPRRAFAAGQHNARSTREAFIAKNTYKLGSITRKEAVKQVPNCSEFKNRLAFNSLIPPVRVRRASELISHEPVSLSCCSSSAVSITSAAVNDGLLMGNMKRCKKSSSTKFAAVLDEVAAEHHYTPVSTRRRYPNRQTTTTTVVYGVDKIIRGAADGDEQSGIKKISSSSSAAGRGTMETVVYNGHRLLPVSPPQRERQEEALSESPPSESPPLAPPSPSDLTKKLLESLRPPSTTGASTSKSRRGGSTRRRSGGGGGRKRPAAARKTYYQADDQEDLASSEEEDPDWSDEEFVEGGRGSSRGKNYGGRRRSSRQQNTPQPYPPLQSYRPNRPVMNPPPPRPMGYARTVNPTPPKPSTSFSAAAGNSSPNLQTIRLKPATELLGRSNEGHNDQPPADLPGLRRPSPSSFPYSSGGNPNNLPPPKIIRVGPKISSGVNSVTPGGHQGPRVIRVQNMVKINPTSQQSNPTNFQPSFITSPGGRKINLIPAATPQGAALKTRIVLKIPKFPDRNSKPAHSSITKTQLPSIHQSISPQLVQQQQQQRPPPPEEPIDPQIVPADPHPSTSSTAACSTHPTQPPPTTISSKPLAVGGSPSKSVLDHLITETAPLDIADIRNLLEELEEVEPTAAPSTSNNTLDPADNTAINRLESQDDNNGKMDTFEQVEDPGEQQLSPPKEPSNLSPPPTLLMAPPSPPDISFPPIFPSKGISSAETEKKRANPASSNTTDADEEKIDQKSASPTPSLESITKQQQHQHALNDKFNDQNEDEEMESNEMPKLDQEEEDPEQQPQSSCYGVAGFDEKDKDNALVVEMDKVDKIEMGKDDAVEIDNQNDTVSSLEKAPIVSASTSVKQQPSLTPSKLSTTSNPTTESTTTLLTTMSSSTSNLSSSHYSDTSLSSNPNPSESKAAAEKLPKTVSSQDQHFDDHRCAGMSSPKSPNSADIDDDETLSLREKYPTLFERDIRIQFSIEDQLDSQTIQRYRNKPVKPTEKELERWINVQGPRPKSCPSWASAYFITIDQARSESSETESSETSNKGSTKEDKTALGNLFEDLKAAGVETEKPTKASVSKQTGLRNC